MILNLQKAAANQKTAAIFLCIITGLLGLVSTALLPDNQLNDLPHLQTDRVSANGTVKDACKGQTPDEWPFSVKISVSPSKISGELVDFPIYVDLSHLGEHFFQHVNPNGYDIRVTAVDGVTELPREVVFIDVVNQTGELHFKAPLLGAASSTRDYLIHYGNSAIVADYAAGDTYGKYNVWSNGYVGIWHKQQTASVMNSREANNGTVLGGVTAGTGIMGGAFSYDGVTGSYVEIPHSALLNVTGTELTMSAWVNPQSIRQNGYVMNKRTGVFGYGMGMTSEFDPVQVNPIVSPGPPCVATINTNEADRQNLKAWTITNGFDGLSGKPTPCYPGFLGSIKFVQHPPVNSAINNWNYFVTTYNGTNVSDPRLNFYWNNTEISSIAYKGNLHGTAVNPTQLRSTSAPLYLGVLTPPGLLPNGLPFQGKLDEIRLSNVARSQDWIVTEYNNQSSPSTFYAVILTTLPVTISSFDVKKMDSKAVLSWVSASTQNASHFDIERSTDGSSFEKIANVTAVENSTSEIAYSWIDNNPSSGKNYYRLKLVDNDGSFKHTKILSLDFNKWEAGISPNPVTDVLNIFTSDSRDIMIYLMDINGKIVLQRKARSGTEKINMGSYPPGIYHVRIYDAKRNMSKTFKVSKIGAQ